MATIEGKRATLLRLMQMDKASAKIRIQLVKESAKADTNKLEVLRQYLPDIDLGTLVRTWIGWSNYEIILPWNPGMVGEVDKAMESAGWGIVSQTGPTPEDPVLHVRWKYNGELKDTIAPHPVQFTWSALLAGSECTVEKTDETEEVVTVEHRTVYKINCK